MERIRQAVEQARRDREKASHVNRPENTESAKVSSSAVADEPSEPHFQYQQTTTITVGSAVRDRNRLVAAIEGHPLQDSYRMLRTRVLQEMKSNGWKTLAITSPAPGAGKTITAVNLAIMIGRDPSCTALLIDGDLRNPSIHRCFSYEPEFGLRDYLVDDVPLERLFFHPDMQGLMVLPGREPIKESAETLASPKMVNMLAEVRSRYADRMVIVDIAPVLSVDDALAIRSHVDCMLMVAESGQTKRDELARAIELLDPVPVIGTVLNKVARKAATQY
jgi:capsular exopolysaccharide synthesis family protein